MWSQKARYAVRALTLLATMNERVTPARSLAEQSGVPPKYLESILGELRGHGLVRSIKGAGGGYAIAHDPSTIRLVDVVRAVDPEALRPGRDGGTRRDAGKRDDRGDREGRAEEPLLDMLEAELLARLEQVTIAEAVMRWHQSREVLTYVI